MFRLIRLPILLCIAFVAGVFYERSETRTLCTAAGGTMTGGLCTGANQ